MFGQELIFLTCWVFNELFDATKSMDFHAAAGHGNVAAIFVHGQWACRYLMRFIKESNQTCDVAAH